ncbi:FCD domain-containing protein [Herbiconiux sp. KACC 21604]|uniref:FadR/GntR family transcriptional regulator n=1 Tax=unclassified Herbiconiux TaxID=2618217 RepID=UPI0014927BE4|nr:FCD domain-containing protein [Herbiconiux sp. SALV-R1]QJU55220.1 FadR family transcriptional regulator [Herbiconiux sp. SALV-R1]WPO86385.1 FCD domain-containing protein [Herbiconiux sp. KACC 21604]
MALSSSPGPASGPRFRTLHRHVIHTLGSRIAAGAFAPGETLPPEPALCESLGVSRGALREAVKALVAKGMLELRPRTGTRVLPREHWNLLDPEVLSWSSDHDREGLIRHLIELRGLIEPGAAALAATRADAEAARRLAETAAAMGAAADRGDADGFTEADVAFHRVLLRSTGNPLLASLNGSLSIALHTSFETTSSVRGAADDTLPLHRAVAEAVAAGDAEAARSAMDDIISTADRHLTAAAERGVIL